MCTASTRCINKQYQQGQCAAACTQLAASTMADSVSYNTKTLYMRVLLCYVTYISSPALDHSPLCCASSSCSTIQPSTAYNKFNEYMLEQAYTPPRGQSADSNIVLLTTQQHSMHPSMPRCSSSYCVAPDAQTSTCCDTVYI
jgi:hypothetical protein